MTLSGIVISPTSKSAKQKLGLLYRNFQLADQKTLSQLYKALVLPMLDYCSCVWDPSSTILSDKLESVQRFAAKLCTKRWSDSPTSLISALNWPTLHSRCSRQKVLLCRRIIKNESIISPSPYFSPLLIIIPGLITLIQFMFHLLGLPLINLHILCLYVICGTAFLRTWSASHPHFLLRLPCCSYHYSSHDVPFVCILPRST